MILMMFLLTCITTNFLLRYIRQVRAEITNHGLQMDFEMLVRNTFMLINIKFIKNKLVTILCKAEKENYSVLLENNIDNVKKTWQLFNGLIRKNSKSDELPKEITLNNSQLQNSKD